MSIVIRPGEPEDVNLIIDSWVKSFAESAIVRAIGASTGAYRIGQRRLIAALLRKPEVEVRVACDASDPTIVFGWACLEPAEGTLHYVYVKRGGDGELRRNGVAKALLGGVEIVRYTHRTNLCAHLPIPRWWQFDPYAGWL
ncbi:MAG: hypothetical protein JOZ73_12075 [Solirubrobacterales bacterium]|nr:hypothetical protein [Solirubrobacterales bacterium]